MIRSQDEEKSLLQQHSTTTASTMMKEVCLPFNSISSENAGLVGRLRTPYGHRVIFYGRAFIIIVIIITFIFLLPPSLCEANVNVGRVAKLAI